MDLTQKIKQQGNQASVLLPGVAASNEVITVDITGCIYAGVDDYGDDLTFIGDPARIQILDWFKSKAKFLRLTFTHRNRKGSALFIKDATKDFSDTISYEIMSNVSELNGIYFIFEMIINTKKNIVIPSAHKITVQLADMQNV